MAAVTAEKETVAKETSFKQQDGETNRKLAEELAHLISQFKGQCKVINTAGKFAKTVKLHPENLDIVFNFKLTDAYPNTVPVIEIRSESLDEDEIFDLQAFLKQSAESMTSVSLEGLVQAALKWLMEGNIDVSGKRAKSKKEDGKENSSRRRQRKSKNKPKDPKEKGKKPPMKTAIDVVKRILWDGALQQDQFLVGYLDRIDGLKEKYFNAFSWEDIASVDYTVLAIPKHRIQYFKYKNEIVWDKRCRLDNVFGSTGSKKTIADVIAHIDGVQGRNDEREIGNNEPEESIADHDSDYYDSDDYSESDSDDGITVTIGNSDGGAIGGMEFDNDYGSDNDVDDKDGDNDQFDKYWRDKLRPNHFIALRITDESIRNTAEEIQKQVIENEPKLKDCKIPRGAMHLTLCTMGLETSEQVENAVKCLQEALPEFTSIVSKDKKLTFKGVETFFNRVIYGRVIDCPPEFYELVDHLKTCLAAKGIDVRDYHEFVPHVTIMKVSRPVAKMTGNSYIAPWLYSSFNDTVLGSQAVDNLHLCAMVDERQEDGFYVAPASFNL
ncbi:leukocyte receptor cluster member 9-like [Mercenaria mercenaria]|uniref:leukocyte receptor cluster member 9-like n=1 Tax=Mercenaria mercenaria TaxID=6596 RepID=UPI00234F0CC0|nr:leukocyte receptor cluster member 9-like [Mercenaria mercenaria]